MCHLGLKPKDEAWSSSFVGLIEFVDVITGQNYNNFLKIKGGKNYVGNFCRKNDYNRNVC